MKQIQVNLQSDGINYIHMEDQRGEKCITAVKHKISPKFWLELGGYF